MSEANRSLATLLLVGAALAAVAGYLIGHRGSSSGGAGHSGAPVALLTPAYVAGVQLETPPDWRAGPSVPEIPGLDLTHAVVLAPGAKTTLGGLIAGELHRGEPSPLPASLLAQMKARPTTAVVGLSRTEAFRYTNVVVPGWTRPLTMYALPNLGASSTLLVCYATAASPSTLGTCEQIVATLHPVGQNGPGNLAPNAQYARTVSSAMQVLDGERTRVRSEIQHATSLALARGPAVRLAHGFAATAAALGHVEPPLIAGQAQAALIRATLGAHEAYEALAAAAAAENTSGYEAAREQVASAETAVDAALQSYALLGYGSA
jgi:hypothetical protein